MLFNSFMFWFFFIGVFSIYWLVPKRFQNRILLVSSYIFYGAWDWRFLFLILISTIVDYILGQKLVQDSPKKRFYLTFSIVTNLGILSIFKYFGFFIDQLDTFFSIIGLEILLPTLDIILPIGISFYTFQTMSYTIDIFRNKTKPVYNFFDFALYVSFFPQLVAGPIERSHKLLPQIIKPRKFKDINFSEGLYFVIYGLFLKVVVADNMATISNAIFSSSAESLIGADVIVGAYAFAFQIYGDFCGYSFIAIGLSKWLGIDLMKNFKAPYISRNPSDFWRRWHISLSTWLRDYLYIPLGGNRKGKRNTYINLLITMVLGGLWHGAGWTFIIWGMFHGSILIIYRILIDKKLFLPKIFKNRIGDILNIILMFHLVCISWIFFRAETIQQALMMLTRLFFDFSYTHQTISMLFIITFFVLPIFIYEIWDENKNYKIFKERSVISLVVFLNYCLFMIIIFPAPRSQDFIYFQF